MLPIDDRLRAVAKGQFSRLAQYEIEVENPLRPKEIQARIRAGETVEEIADAAGIPVDRVRWFEGPVLAERGYVAQQAQNASVRRQGDSTPGPRLGGVVAERLTELGADPEDAQWDSRKHGDGSWQVQLAFRAGGRLHIAEWLFDPRRRHVSPADDNAERLSLPEAELPAPTGGSLGAATVTPIRPRPDRSQAPAAPDPVAAAYEEPARAAAHAASPASFTPARPPVGRPSSHAAPQPGGGARTAAADARPNGGRCSPTAGGPTAVTRMIQGSAVAAAGSGVPADTGRTARSPARVTTPPTTGKATTPRAGSGPEGLRRRKPSRSTWPRRARAHGMRPAGTWARVIRIPQGRRPPPPPRRPPGPPRRPPLRPPPLRLPPLRPPPLRRPLLRPGRWPGARRSGAGRSGSGRSGSRRSGSRWPGTGERPPPGPPGPRPRLRHRARLSRPPREGRGSPAGARQEDRRIARPAIVRPVVGRDHARQLASAGLAGTRPGRPARPSGPERPAWARLGRTERPTRPSLPRCACCAHKIGHRSRPPARAASYLQQPKGKGGRAREPVSALGLPLPRRCRRRRRVPSAQRVRGGLRNRDPDAGCPVHDDREQRGIQSGQPASKLHLSRRPRRVDQPAPGLDWRTLGNQELRHRHGRRCRADHAVHLLDRVRHPAGDHRYPERPLAAAGAGRRNSLGQASYDPPCPDSPGHSYRFTVYALKSTLNLPSGTSTLSAWMAIANAAIARGAEGRDRRSMNFLGQIPEFGRNLSDTST